MAKVKQGDRVRINFTGRLADGTLIESTTEVESCCSDESCTDGSCDDGGCVEHESGPMELLLGNDDFFPEVEEALIGMSPGEVKTVVIPAENAFGAYDENLVFPVDRDELPEELEVEVGDYLVMTDENDEETPVIVTEIGPDSVMMDANHPFAGEDLHYEVELVEIV